MSAQIVIFRINHKEILAKHRNKIAEVAMGFQNSFNSQRQGNTKKKRVGEKTIKLRNPPGTKGLIRAQIISEVSR